MYACVNVSKSVSGVCCVGGHTSEILRLTGSLSPAYTPRYYVVADTDRMSEEKITTFENSKGESHPQVQRFPFCYLDSRPTISERSCCVAVLLKC